MASIQLSASKVMSNVFDQLPGVALPVREVTDRLASIWETDNPDYPISFHASQMNVVLHFGLATDSQTACKRFDGLIRFAQRYPCRIIVLCPTESDLGNGMESKLFSQCYIGKSQREMCCCEALILRYSQASYEYLFDQISIWLESDLPTYYWFSELLAQKMRERYVDKILQLGVRRCVFDSSVNSSELGAPDWPKDLKTGDLAEARLLPMRQIIGQFLSQYPIETICEGLASVQVRYSGASGEADSLLKWVQTCLHTYDKPILRETEFLLTKVETSSPYSLGVSFHYSDYKHFSCDRLRDGFRCEVKADFGQGVKRAYVPIEPLTDEQILAEAFFFI